MISRRSAWGSAMAMLPVPIALIAFRFFDPQTAPSPPKPAAWATPLITQAAILKFSPAGPISKLATGFKNCLLPAFLIAGAMSALIPKEVVTRYLGPNSPKYVSYPAATAAALPLLDPPGV